MSTISKDEVARVAQLARIELTAEQTEQLAGELDVIVEAIAKVSAIATDDIPATSHPLPLVNVFRADTPEETLSVADIFAGAPESQDDRFLVPQILGEE